MTASTSIGYSSIYQLISTLETKPDDLAALVADAAQNYFALSVELGFVKQQDAA